MKSILKLNRKWFLIIAPVVLLYFYGIIHTFRDHSATNGIIAVVLFPYALYEGIMGLIHFDKVIVVNTRYYHKSCGTECYYLRKSRGKKSEVELSEVKDNHIPCKACYLYNK